MKTLCIGVSKRVPFQAFLFFVWNKAFYVTYFYSPAAPYKGVFFARALKGCKDRVFLNLSAFSYSCIKAVCVQWSKNYSDVEVSGEEMSEILKSH